MEVILWVTAILFGSLFIGKAAWLIYISVFRRDLIQEDDGSPVSGWGSPGEH